MSLNEKLCPVLLKVSMSWDVPAEQICEDFDINAVADIKFQCNVTVLTLQSGLCGISLLHFMQWYKEQC